MAVNPNPYQNTNSGALIRLKPLENNNIGAIVEEHIRYWQKYKDNQEAEKLANQARENEYKRKLQKQAFDLYEGIRPEDTKGYFNSQIIGLYEKNKEAYSNLAKQASNGDIDALIKLKDIKDKFVSLSKANEIYSTKISDLNKQKSEGFYNPVLDINTQKQAESFSKGLYKINDDFTLEFYNPNTQETQRLSPSQLYDNDFLNYTYSKPADFDGQAKKIATDLLNTEDGQKLIDDPTTKRRGVSISRAVLDEDNKFARSWYGTAQQRGLIDFNTAYDDLSEVEKNKLAETYYDNVVFDKIQEVRNPLGIAQKKQALTNSQLEATKKRQSIKKGKQDLQEADLSLATTEDGEQIKTDLRKGDFSDFNKAVKEGTILNIVGTPTKRDVSDEKETAVTFTHLIRDDKTGDLTVIGKEVVTEKVPVLNDDGTVQEDSNGNQKFTTKQSVQTRIIDSDSELNTLSDMFGVKNLEEINQKVEDVIGKENIKPKTKPKFN